MSWQGVLAVAIIIVNSTTTLTQHPAEQNLFSVNFDACPFYTGTGSGNMVVYGQEQCISGMKHTFQT